jgi:hypothetical protein
MGFNLSPHHVPAETRYMAGDDIILTSEQELWLRKKVGGWQDVFKWSVPPGKKWTVVLNVRIIEEDNP